MNRFLLLLALVVGVAWCQVQLRPAALTEVADPLTRPTASPQDLEAARCLARDTVTEAEVALDNPEDQQYQISTAESEKLLKALEAEGIAEERTAAETRNAEFAAPVSAKQALIKWPCPSSNSYCPHYWRRLTTVRHKGSCGVEFCRPLSYYSTYYAVCSCPTCRKGQGRCVPTAYRSRLIQAHCFSHLLGWNIRAIRVTLPSACGCRSFCLV